MVVVGVRRRRRLWCLLLGQIGEALTNDRGRLLMNSKLALPPQMEVLTEAAEMAVGAKARHSAARVVEVPKVVQKP